MENKNPIVYVSVDKSLLSDVVCDVYPWLQKLGFSVVDLVDAYATENYPADQRDERLKKKDKASVYLFVAKSDVGAKVYKRFRAEAKYCGEKNIPLILMRYKGTAAIEWECCPENVLKIAKCCCGYNRESLKEALVYAGIINDNDQEQAEM